MVDDDWELDILRRLNSVRACVPARAGPGPLVRACPVAMFKDAGAELSDELGRIHGELAGLGVKVAASTVWEITTATNALTGPASQCTPPATGSDCPRRALPFLGHLSSTHVRPSAEPTSRFPQSAQHVTEPSCWHSSGAAR